MFFELLVLVVVEVVGRIIRKIYSFFYDRFRRVFNFRIKGGLEPAPVSRCFSDQSSKSSSRFERTSKSNSFFFGFLSSILSESWVQGCLFSLSRKTIRPPGCLNSSCNIVTKNAWPSSSQNVQYLFHQMGLAAKSLKANQGKSIGKYRKFFQAANLIAAPCQ